MSVEIKILAKHVVACRQPIVPILLRNLTDKPIEGILKVARRADKTEVKVSLKPYERKLLRVRLPGRVPQIPTWVVLSSRIDVSFVSDGKVLAEKKEDVFVVPLSFTAMAIALSAGALYFLSEFGMIQLDDTVKQNLWGVAVAAPFIEFVEQMSICGPF